jgi:hypothetical protein
LALAALVVRLPLVVVVLLVLIQFFLQAQLMVVEVAVDQLLVQELAEMVVQVAVAMDLMLL